MKRLIIILLGLSSFAFNQVQSQITAISDLQENDTLGVSLIYMDSRIGNCGMDEFKLIRTNSSLKIRTDKTKEWHELDSDEFKCFMDTEETLNNLKCFSMTFVEITFRNNELIEVARPCESEIKEFLSILNKKNKAANKG